MIRNRAAEITPETIETMQMLAEQMRRSGQNDSAEHLVTLKAAAEREAAAARWR